MDEDIKQDQALVATIAGSDLTLWSEERQNQFVDTFKDRSCAARYILAKTAEVIFETAEHRKFVSGRHKMKAFGTFSRVHPSDFFSEKERKEYAGHYWNANTVGGRAIKELDQIAEERAEEVLKNLPALKDAVQIIDPETAKKITRLEVLKKRGQEIAEELTEITQPIVFEDLPDTMTIGEFRAHVKGLEKRRRELLDRLSDIGTEGSSLEGQVNKTLYGGLPGLTDAVCKVVLEHLERSAALDVTSRRVEYLRKLGNNEAALDLLRHFEKDEKTISESVGASFKAALEKLQLASKKSKSGKKSAVSEG